MRIPGSTLKTFELWFIQQHADFTPVTLVYCTRAIQYGNSALPCQPTPGTNLALRTAWQLQRNSSPYSFVFRRPDAYVFDRAQVEPGITCVGVCRPSGPGLQVTNLNPHFIPTKIPHGSIRGMRDKS